MKRKEKLISLAIKYNGDLKKIAKAYINNEEAPSVYYENCFTIFDECYPSAFLKLNAPPLVIFYKGNLDLLKHEAIGVVGSRNACKYALEATKALVLNNDDKVIISGLAKGIDAQAHRFAKKTIGILGCGIDYIYPYDNKDLFIKIANEGLILSEYPNYVKPLRYHFPFRNRLIASLSKEIYVMQSRAKSGTFATINEGLELGKDIKVLPYDIFNPDGIYNNYLIQEGALIISYKDLFV